MTHPPAPAFAAPPRALRGGPRSPQSGMRRPAPVTPSAPLSQPRAVPLTLTQTRDRDAVPERAAMPREMTGFYRAGVQVGGCFVGIAAGRPSSSGSGYTDLVYLFRPGSPKRKQFRPGVDPARRQQSRTLGFVGLRILRSENRSPLNNSTNRTKPPRRPYTFLKPRRKTRPAQLE